MWDDWDDAEAEGAGWRGGGAGALPPPQVLAAGSAGAGTCSAAMPAVAGRGGGGGAGALPPPQVLAAGSAGAGTCSAAMPPRQPVLLQPPTRVLSEEERRRLHVGSPGGVAVDSNFATQSWDD
jgi:hypothetical protein